MINSKNLKVPLIVDYKYKINNKVLIFDSEDSLCINFRDDSIIIHFDKDKYSYEPLYNINDYVFFNSKIYQIKDVDEKYNYTISKEINDNEYIIATTNVKNLQKLPVDIMLKTIKSRKSNINNDDDFDLDIGNPLVNTKEINDLINDTIDRQIKYSYCCRCCCNDQNSYNLIISLKTIDLSDDYKYIIVNRYIKTLIYHENQITQIYGIYNVFRFIIQTGSILTPALLSIQHIFEGDQPNLIYWATWGISLIVGLLANYISLFGLDKKYFTYEKSYHLLVSYGWQYLQLSGKYGKPKDSTIFPTHDNMFVQFCNDIENLLLKEALSISDSMKDKTGTSTKTPHLKAEKHTRTLKTKSK